MNKFISEVTNEDCMEGMARYPDKYFDLAIVDPPYGNFNESISRTGGTWAKKYQKPDKSIINWDFCPPESYFIELFRVSKNQIIWGGNYFKLPPTKNFLIWHKETISENFTMSMVEFAWGSFNDNAKLFKFRPQRKDGIHPTQKPIELYQWILKRYAKQGDKILDTHLGSGSSRIAAYEMGFDFTAFELDTEYFEAQEKRYKAHIAQLKMELV